MTGKSTELDDYDNASEALAEMTGRDESEFDASGHEIPDFADEEVITMTSDSETGPVTSSNGDCDPHAEWLPLIPWCGDCWDQAAEGTAEDRDGELPDECQNCGSDEVFWI